MCCGNTVWIQSTFCGMPQWQQGCSYRGVVRFYCGAYTMQMVCTILASWSACAVLCYHACATMRV